MPPRSSRAGRTTTRASSSRKRSSPSQPTRRSRTTWSPSSRSRNRGDTLRRWGRGDGRGPTLSLHAREPALLQQRGDIRLATAEGTVQFHRVARVAGAVDLFEAAGQLGIEDIAFLGKGGKAVGL